MNSTDQAIVLAQIFTDRVAWFLVAGGELHGHGTAESLAELRMVQLRAGIAFVALFAPRHRAELEAALVCYDPEWRAATAAELRLLEIFFTRTGQGNAYAPTRPQPATA